MQILAGIVLLGVLITFHELGHFLIAKWLGVRVLVFSVGFGPKLIGFTKNGTEYRLSAIPLGGYVKMFGESLEEDLTPLEKEHSFLHQPTWRKSLIAFAGPLFNFILPVILFFFLFVGYAQVFAPKIGTVLSEGAAFKAGMKSDDEITAVDGKPMQSFNQVAKIVSQNPDKDLSFNIRRKVGEKYEDLNLIVRPQKKELNSLLNGKEALGRIGIMPATLLPIIFVSKDSPLYSAGLSSLDEIIKIDEEPVKNMTQLMSLLEHIKEGSKITFLKQGSVDKNTILNVTNISMHKKANEKAIVVNNNLGNNFDNDIAQKIETTKTLLKQDNRELLTHFGIASARGVINQIKADSVMASLGLSLGDRIVALNGESISMVQVAENILENPFKPHVLGITKTDGSDLIIIFLLPKETMEKVGLDTDMLSAVGFTTYQVFKPGEMVELKVGILEALNRSINETANIVVMTVKSLGMLIRNEAPVSQLGGPIMLFDVAQKAAQKGWAYYIYIMCLISVNLGLLNLLPIPALDGGHLLLFGIETIQGKPLTQKTRAIATQIGVAILLTLMALALFNDIMRFFR
jgi:regulator of sigma E protease